MSQPCGFQVRVGPNRDQVQAFARDPQSKTGPSRAIWARNLGAQSGTHLKEKWTSPESFCRFRGSLRTCALRALSETVRTTAVVRTGGGGRAASLFLPCSGQCCRRICHPQRCNRSLHRAYPHHGLGFESRLRQFQRHGPLPSRCGSPCMLCSSPFL
jgi:hypothetical protein